MKIDYLKRAFTLSEVLITLSILGVVAAIIIPNIVNNYNKKQTEVGLLRAYTMLQKGLEVSQAINGPFATWEKLSGSSSLSPAEFNERYILPYIIPVSYKCDYYGNHSGYFNRTKCFKDGIKDVNGNIWGIGDCGQCGHISLTTYRLKNGMSLSTAWKAYSNFLFIVDINGPDKGKNTVGADIFMFSLKYGTQSGAYNVRPPEFMTGQANVGYYVNRKDYIPSASSDLANCGPNSSTQSKPQQEFGVLGNQCSRRIERNGWKIPNDYPIKRF